VFFHLNPRGDAFIFFVQATFLWLTECFVVSGSCGP
jgi:hypothetical protein